LEIKTPRGRVFINNKTMKAELEWGADFGRELSYELGMDSPLQRFADDYILRTMEPYVPKDTGMLYKSATLGTHIGSGELRFIAPYSRYLFYGILMVDSVTGSSWATRGGTKVATSTKLNYHGGDKAGAHWDKLWKADNLDTYVRQLQSFGRR